jgi:ABC-type Fe3+-siderophore transport system permease subunit
MRTTFISLGIALLLAALVWVSIIFLDPGMNLDRAYNIIVCSFIGSAVLAALVLTLRSRRQSE